MANVAGIHFMVKMQINMRSMKSPDKPEDRTDPRSS